MIVLQVLFPDEYTIMGIDLAKTKLYNPPQTKNKVK